MELAWTLAREVALDGNRRVGESEGRKRAFVNTLHSAEWKRTKNRIFFLCPFMMCKESEVVGF